jgi:hypothetical protein
MYMNFIVGRMIISAMRTSCGPHALLYPNPATLDGQYLAPDAGSGFNRLGVVGKNEIPANGQ